MKLHSRTMPCEEAQTDLHGVLLDWLERHPDLSWSEAVRCLASLIASWAVYPVCEERHPTDSDKEADEE